MKALKKLVVAALALSVPLASLAQAPAAEPAKPAETPPPAATPAPAPKPPVSVTIYGTLNVNAQQTWASGAKDPAKNVAGRTAVSIDSSNIGFRGTVVATDMVSGTFQCETGANVDGVSTVSLCNRNSRVGLTGPWGTLFYGNWDTAYKAAIYGTKADDAFGKTDVFGYDAIFGSPGVNTKTAAWKLNTTDKVTGFDLRAGNSIAYHSPQVQGLSAKMQYSVNEEKVANVNPWLLSGAVNYDNGPVSLLAAAERHEDGFGLDALATAIGGVPAGIGTAESRDFAWKFGGGYELALPGSTLTVSALFERLQYKAVVAATKIEYHRSAWLVGAKYRVGQSEFRARYSMADKGDCDVSGGSCTVVASLGAKNLALGYAYIWNKNLETYLHYSMIRNDRDAQYTFTTGGSDKITGATAAGADPSAVALGIRYAF